MGSPEDRERLASSFDAAADLYHLARPEYPKAIYDHLLAVTQLRPSARLLEIGAGTGKATLPLALFDGPTNLAFRDQRNSRLIGSWRSSC